MSSADSSPTDVEARHKAHSDPADTTHSHPIHLPFIWLHHIREVRIAQVANFIGPASGGVKTAVTALGKGYVSAGCERLLVIPGPMDRMQETAQGRVVQLKAPHVGGGYRMIMQPWRIIEALEHFAPDSVELADKWSLVPVSRWARNRGVQSVLFNHEHLYAMLSLRTGLKRSLETPIELLNKVLVRSVDAIVVTSEFARREFQEAARRAGTPVQKVPLGVDLDVFRPHPRADVTPRGALRLVHVGRLSREKSPHLAVATGVELHRRGVAIQMDIYGDGPHRDEIQQLAQGAPITFHGFVPNRTELARAIAAADIALSACPGETFGLAVLEALAAGTPVVTADRGGARELVTSSCGDWAAPDPAALADAVLRLAERDRIRREQAARARATQFQWETCVARMLEVHQRAQIKSSA